MCFRGKTYCSSSPGHWLFKWLYRVLKQLPGTKLFFTLLGYEVAAKCWEKKKKRNSKIPKCYYSFILSAPWSHFSFISTENIEKQFKGRYRGFQLQTINLAHPSQVQHHIQFCFPCHYHNSCENLNESTSNSEHRLSDYWSLNLTKENTQLVPEKNYTFLYIFLIEHIPFSTDTLTKQSSASAKYICIYQ